MKVKVLVLALVNLNTNLCKVVYKSSRYFMDIVNWTWEHGLISADLVPVGQEPAARALLDLRPLERRLSNLRLACAGCERRVEV